MGGAVEKSDARIRPPLPRFVFQIVKPDPGFTFVVGESHGQGGSIHTEAADIAVAVPNHHDPSRIRFQSQGAGRRRADIRTKPEPDKKNQ